MWEKAGQNGLLGVNIKEEHSGIGGDVLSTAITWEEQCVSLSLMKIPSYFCIFFKLELKNEGC